MLHGLPKHELYPTPEQARSEQYSQASIEKVDLALAGYSYACIGLGASLINRSSNQVRTHFEAQDISRFDTAGYSFCSLEVVSAQSSIIDKKVLLAYQADCSDDNTVQSLSRLLIMGSTKRNATTSLFVVEDPIHAQHAYRYTYRKGWHTPSVRFIKKVFFEMLLPLEKCQEAHLTQGFLDQNEYEHFEAIIKAFDEHQNALR